MNAWSWAVISLVILAVLIWLYIWYKNNYFIVKNINKNLDEYDIILQNKKGKTKEKKIEKDSKNWKKIENEEIQVNQKYKKNWKDRKSNIRK